MIMKAMVIAMVVDYTIDDNDGGYDDIITFL